MIDVQDIARKLDVDGTPALKRLPDIALQLQEAMTKANRLIGSVDKDTAIPRSSTATSIACCPRSPTRRARSAPWPIS